MLGKHTLSVSLSLEIKSKHPLSSRKDLESIAAWLQRPLLALTVADIGTKEIKVEQELLKWLDIAEAWNAVLLVDEADIFLEQRKTRDLARNGLVSGMDEAVPLNIGTTS